MGIISLDDKVKYIGYKSDNLERFRPRILKPVEEELKQYHNLGNNSALIEMSNLPMINLSEVKSLAKKFYEKYFSLNKVNILLPQKLSQKKYEYIISSSKVEEFYNRLNSEVKKVNPFNMNITLMNGHSINGYAKKEFMIPKYNFLKSNRKVYFSEIGLGDMLTPLSGATLVHEIAHTQMEQNIGYAQDYLNSEVINIFLEKVAALEIDKTGDLLKIQENFRMEYLSKLYFEICDLGSSITREKRIANLVYIKSILIANKMFDMYLKEKMIENKDKYIYDIQDIFDGKITVEDFISARGITTEECVDSKIFKKYL